MKNDIDFYMIQDKSIDKIFGAIDLNNMIPVMPNNYTKLTYENLDNLIIIVKRKVIGNY